MVTSPPSLCRGPCPQHRTPWLSALLPVLSPRRLPTVSISIFPVPRLPAERAHRLSLSLPQAFRDKRFTREEDLRRAESHTARHARRFKATGGGGGRFNDALTVHELRGAKRASSQGGERRMPRSGARCEQRHRSNPTVLRRVPPRAEGRRTQAATEVPTLARGGRRGGPTERRRGGRGRLTACAQREPGEGTHEHDGGTRRSRELHWCGRGVGAARSRVSFLKPIKGTADWLRIKIKDQG